MKSIKLSDYFEIVRPKYVFLKLTPVTSIRNYNSDKIIKAAANMYKSLNRCFNIYNRKLFFEVQSKIGYYIYIEKQKVEFYFIVPSSHLALMKDKIMDTWKGITITQVNSIPMFSPQAIRYTLDYKNEDGLSLTTDKRNNILLSSILNVINILNEGDRIGIFYNFMPVSQSTWRADYKRTIDKYRLNMPIDKNKLSSSYILKTALNIIIAIVDIILNSITSILGGEEKKSEVIIRPQKSLSDETIRKKDSIIVQTQALIMSEGPDLRNARNNALAVCESFKSISGDNELTYRRHYSKYDILQYKITGADTMNTSPAECQHFVSLPGRELLTEYKCIEKIDTYENEVPEQLRKGVMCIGENTYRGSVTKAYLTEDPELRNLAVALIGPTRAGKSTLLQNLARDAINAGECVIVPDFISNNKLSSDIEKVIPRNKQLCLDMNDLDHLEGMGFNEVWGIGKSPLEQYDYAKDQTTQFITLIDSINEENKELAVRMERYLEAACNVVFISKGTFKDVIEVLRDYNSRHKFISMIPGALIRYMKEYIDTLLELDEVDKKTGETDTRLSRVIGILDRLNRLKANTVMEIMLKNTCDHNINLLKEIQKPQLITIKMPERRFKTQKEKDFMTTYWLSKFWMSLQIRDWMIPDRRKRVKVNLIIDELYQVPQAQRLLTEKLSQMAKFDCKAIISCHYLGQIPIIRDELKAANSSYVLISGCDKDNFKELKEELAPYELEDLLNLKRYHALNLLRYEGGYAKFITKLPPPIVKTELLSRI